MSAVTCPQNPRTVTAAHDDPAGGRSWVRAVVAVVAVAVAVAVLLRQGVPLDQVTVSGRGWGWVLVAALLTAVSFLGAGWNLSGFVPGRLLLRRVVAAQVVAAGARIVTPAGLGAHAVNLRLLRRSGEDTPVAVGAVAGAQAAQLVVTVVLLVAAALAPGRRLPELGAPTATATVVVAVGAAALAAGLAWAVRARRQQVVEQLTHVRAALRVVLRSPRRWLQALGGAVLLSTALAGALWASAMAVGTAVHPLDALVVVLVGAGVGSAVPTPGGTGGVEAAMTAGLVAVGTPLAAALPAVLLYRLLSLWLPVPVGLAAAVRLRSAGVL
ncbi:lysylphosphatidylglycerol synthase domain-containing protein [Ornithinimicrobium pekingense]|uniref:Flippase-like domain-containing protein n=1 Tax=Ornithinimicrobium pekingense TaxID=384677 RepID=A0ABQ2F6D3_9MICO|nr:lysylphosphatidylglycerol synthase domain-containing protein [Ornithinimicrobium pekingense]GGK58218.1 hypothetical protein GCM10011509_03290 [Ornithinimicrobium pekingense]